MAHSSDQATAWPLNVFKAMNKHIHILMKKTPLCRRAEGIAPTAMVRFAAQARHVRFHPVLPLLLVFDAKNVVFLYSLARNSILKLEKQFPVPPHGGEVRDLQFADAHSLLLSHKTHSLPFDRLGDATLLLLAETHLLSYNYALDKCFKSEVDANLPQKVTFTCL